MSRFTHTTELLLHGTLDTVFPLFGPIREKEWAADWNPVLVYSESPLGDQSGTIFTVSHGPEHKAVWYVNQFDAAHWVVEYLCVMPHDVMKVIQIHCEPTPEHQTRAFVTYTYTALGSDGDSVIARLPQHHPAMVAEWEAMINSCLQR
jgi:hypothetical protein